MIRETARRAETPSVENPPGILRTTIAYNDQLMLCHFTLKKGVRVPFHNHPASQNGYLISGRLRMLWEDGREFVAEPGGGWCFGPSERHGAEALEDCEAIECFAPSRPEYEPG
jgi:quercetin dioxygenase-like cupin family protein